MEEAYFSQKKIMNGLILFKERNMIEVEFNYKNISGEWKTGSRTFYDVEKAIRFIYKCQRDPRLSYSSFSADDSETCEYINWRMR